MKKNTDRPQSISIVNGLFLCAVVAVYSLSGLFTKKASMYDFLSIPYFSCLLGLVFVLGLYAVLWQVVLKGVPLSRAYLFRSLTVVYGLGLAYFVFHENITAMNIIGALVVLCGLLILLGEKTQ
jgi:drug/metabolite transporter (DMT)-like permease